MTLTRAWRNAPLIAGGLIVGIVVLTAALASFVAPYDPEMAVPAQSLLPPGPHHLLGTDASGMDVFSRLVFAPRVDLLIAGLGTLISFAVGVPIGLVLGYGRGIWSDVGMRTFDVLQALPFFIVAMAIVAMTGQNTINVIWVVALVNIPIYVRLVQAQVLSHRERQYVRAARSIGNSRFRILWRHILPNVVAPAIVQTSVNLGWAILLTAGLSFVGAGVRVPTPEWGIMIAEGAGHLITGQWWLAFFAGLAASTTVFGFNLLGNGLQRILQR